MLDLMWCTYIAIFLTPSAVLCYLVSGDDAHSLHTYTQTRPHIAAGFLELSHRHSQRRFTEMSRASNAMKAGSTAHSSGCLDDTNVSGSWRPDTGLHVIPHTHTHSTRSKQRGKVNNGCLETVLSSNLIISVTAGNYFSINLYRNSSV